MHDPLTPPTGFAYPKYEYAELNFQQINFEHHPECDFVPYGNYYDDDANYGERHFSSYLDAMDALSASGWMIAASTTNTASGRTKILFQRPLNQGDN